ncbi:MAG: DUF6614 family protein [Pseudomonadota bacterium]
MDTMPMLVSQFNLKPGVTAGSFETAWKAFVAELTALDLAVGSSALMSRQKDSGFDTDAPRDHRFMTLIRFSDQAQADLAWTAIETADPRIGRTHVGVLALVEDPVFTFWAG